LSTKIPQSITTRPLCVFRAIAYLGGNSERKDHPMLTQIRGLHHVTSMASDARATDRFFTGPLGLRRVKKTVNFDAPDVYHLYYADRIGTPGSVMTYFPFPDIGPRRRGAGEVGTTAYAVPAGALPYWAERLARAGINGLASGERFGDAVLAFEGPDGDEFALVEVDGDPRAPWTGNGVPAEHAIHGFHSVHLRLRDPAPTAELLGFMGYTREAEDGSVTRYRREGGNHADAIDLEAVPDAPWATQGAGSVHHVAFAVDDRAAQAEVRKALADAGASVTPQIDRDYFWAIYFRSPGGVLFEVATNEPGFARDEDPDHLGEGLMLPSQHAHLRDRLERRLAPLE
jgi:glyoxalase family protein